MLAHGPGLVLGWRDICPSSLARARQGHPSVRRRGPTWGSPLLAEAVSCPLNASTPAPPQSLLGKMVLYRSLEAWPGISRSSGLTKFEGILWRGRGSRCVSSSPLPGLPSPTSLVEGPRSLLASGGRSGWGAGRGWSRLLPGAPGVLSPKGPRGQACQLLLIQRGSDSGGPCSHQEFLFQLRGAGWPVLQGLPAEGASGGAQEVQRDLLGRAHGANGLHGPQGPHIQHQGHIGAAPAAETARSASTVTAVPAPLMAGSLSPRDPEAQAPGTPAPCWPVRRLQTQLPPPDAPTSHSWLGP